MAEQSPLDREIAAYHATRAWLRGDKPPAQGRTWRRRLRLALMQRVATQPGPHPVTRVLLALGGSHGGFLRVTLGCTIVMAQLWLVTHLTGSLPPADLALEKFIEQLRPLEPILSPIVGSLGCISLALAGLAWAFDPHAP